MSELMKFNYICGGGITKKSHSEKVVLTYP